MPKDRLRWIAALVFLLLCLVQVFKWGAMQLPIQGPIFVIFAAGLVVAAYRDALPFRNHLLFVCSYGAVFILLWAVGHPNIEIVPGRTWMVSLVASVALAATLLWNLRGHRGWRWIVALALSVSFGLFIAFASGPRGGSDWMQALVMRMLDLPGEEWRTAHQIVVIFRKSMHFCGYGAAAYATASAALRSGAALRRSLLLGLSWAIPLAIFDEWQQRFAANRTGKTGDILLDISGMLAFLFVFWLVHRKESEVQS